MVPQPGRTLVPVVTLFNVTSERDTVMCFHAALVGRGCGSLDLEEETPVLSSCRICSRCAVGCTNVINQILARQPC